jgi:SAM-dependent methyltransferase
VEKLVYKDEQLWSSIEKNIEPLPKLEEITSSIMIGRILDLTEEDDSILELGCGTARDSSYLAFQGRRVIGMDISSHALRVAKKVTLAYNTNVYLVRGNANTIPFRDETFDFVFSTLVMCYFKDLNPLIEEQRRVLKSGKYLAIYVPYRYSLFTIEKHQKMLSGKWPWGWETEFSLRQLKRMFVSHGFSIISAWKNPNLDRYLRILLDFHQTRYGKKLPEKILKVYKYLTIPFRTLAEKCVPTSIVVIGRKD